MAFLELKFSDSDAVTELGCGLKAPAGLIVFKDGGIAISWPKVGLGELCDGEAAIC